MTYRALDGIRILHLGGGVAGHYCTRLLASYGAEVTLVEPPEGDPIRRLHPLVADHEGPEASAAFAYLTSGQRSVVLDLTDESDREVALRLTADVDAVVDSHPPGTLEALGIGPAALRARNPALVVTSVTAFGTQGPYADWPAAEIVIQATGGWMFGLGDPDREPLKAPGVQAQQLGGLCAAMATLGSLRGARRDELGDHLDVSCQAAVAWFLMNPTTVHEYSGTVWTRAGGRSTTNYPQGVMPCADGLVGVNVMYYVEWDRLCTLVERPDWQTDPRLATPLDRLQNAEVIDEVLLAWLGDRTLDEVLQTAQDHKLPFSRIATIDDLLASDHLAVRDYWRIQDDPVLGAIVGPGPPFKLSAVPEELEEKPAPTLGEHTSQVHLEATDRPHSDAQGRAPQHAPVAGNANPTAPGSGLPLQDVVVVDLSMAWAGPLAVRVLAELGAQVIKIEGASHMDRWRGGTTPQRGTSRYPDNDPGERPWNRNAFFNTQNRHKRSLALDLKSDRGKDIFRQLVAQADVVVENFSAAALGRLGLDYHALRDITPDLVMVSLPAFGMTGPESGQVAHGPTIEAAAGNLRLQGYDGEDGLASGLLAWGDPIAGMNGAVAALVALTHRDLTGRGTHVDLSHVEAAIPLNVQAVLDRTVNGVRRGPRGNRDDVAWPQGCYPCRGDDRWIVCSCPDDAAWHRLAMVIGADELDSDRLSRADARRRAAAEIDVAITRWTSDRTTSDAVAALHAAGIPAAPVHDAIDLGNDPNLRAAGFFQTITHPEAGTHRYPGMPWRSATRPWKPPVPAPCFGEHNRQILHDHLQLRADDVDQLTADGIITDHPDTQGD